MISSSLVKSLIFENDVLNRDPVSKPIGIMLIMLAAMSLVFHYGGLRLSNSVAMLIIGIVIGAAKLNEDPLVISDEIAAALLEVGAMLHMFYEGLSLDFDKFEKYWREILIVSVSHLCIITGIFVLVGWGSQICDDKKSCFFFGLLCAFASTNLVQELLRKKEADMLIYGRIARGVQFANDIFAVTAFAFIHAFMEARKPDTGNGCDTASASRRAGSADGSVSCYSERLFDVSDTYLEIGKSAGIMVGACLIFFLLSRYALGSVFAFFTKEPELLFIGTVAYALGTGALCHAAGFSRMTGE